jgi:2Fe-2S ferredoxin
MPVLHVIGRDGIEQEINAPAGTSLMEPLRDMDDGVTAICGGMCSCATCQVYIDEAWMPRLTPAMSDETDMLRDLTSYRPNSRLACQIPLTDALDGLRVTIAPEE